MTKTCIVLLLLGLQLPVIAHQLEVHTATIHLGQTPIQIRHEYYGPGKVFVHLHANETTALLAGRAVARQTGGQVITLVHQKTRDVHFQYRRYAYTVDPNRIFTPQGVRQTLLQHGCYDPRVIPMIKHFAQAILKLLPMSQQIIAIHNNKDYSLRDYFPHHELAQDASRYYYQANSNYRNFYLVTAKKDFTRYKAMGFNVLEQAKVARDDGSLSIVMAQQPYVNVEAGFGQFQAQKKMLLNA